MDMVDETKMQGEARTYFVLGNSTSWPSLRKFNRLVYTWSYDIILLSHADCLQSSDSSEIVQEVGKVFYLFILLENGQQNF